MNQRPHKNRSVWKESMELIKCIYRITVTFPDGEKFGIISQIRRASISIVTNIAEGVARSTKRDYNHFLNISHRSLSEISDELNFLIT